MIRRTLAWTAVLTLVAAFAQSTPAPAASGAAEDASYLSQVGSDPATTNGVSRLLHYLPGDLPMAVYVPEPDAPDAAAKRDAVVRALRAWQQAAPDLVPVMVVGAPGPDVVEVRWLDMQGKAGSYRYRFSVTGDNQYRFRATEVWLDPSDTPEALQRFALLEFGHALGLLGRSPYTGDAMSAAPSGVVSPRDVATLRALYGVPSGTEINR